MTKERSLYLDVLRAVSIILVIVGHSIQYGSGSEYLKWGVFFYNPVFIFIYSFHMPLLMLISGYLFAYSCKNKTNKEVFIVKCKQLLIPLICWSFISLVVQMIKIFAGAVSQKITLLWICQTVLSGFWGGPWFLWAIFWSVVVILLGRKFFKDSWVFYLVVTLLTLVMPDAHNSAVYKFMWPFFMLAYLFNAYDLKTKWKQIYSNNIFGICCLFIFVVLLHFYNFNTYIYTSGFYVLDKVVLFQIHNNCFRFVIGLVGSLFAMWAVYALVEIMPRFISKAFAYIGQCTLGIYLISNYLFDEVLKIIPFSGLNYWWVIVQAFGVLGVTILLTTLLKRFKTTNKLFLGGR